MHWVAVGQQTSEKLKLAIGSAMPLPEELESEVRGREVASGLPKNVTLSSDELRDACAEPLRAIVEAVKATLERTPPELAADISTRGILLAGGGALLRGFDRLLACRDAAARRHRRLSAHLRRARRGPGARGVRGARAGRRPPDAAPLPRARAVRRSRAAKPLAREMTAFVTAAAGFLLAVLWFDLMFDVQVRRPDERERAVASMAAYYRRVTLEAYPMNRLVAAFMAAALAALVVQVADGEAPRWVSIASLGLTLAATTLAVGHTFRNGARLGSGRGTADERAELARLMLRDHVVCLAAITGVLVLQLGFAS